MGALFGTIHAGDVALVAQMGARLAHRGSAGSDAVAVGRAILAGRGDEPLRQPWMRDGLTLVGDIDLYNADQLRSELAKEGGPADVEQPEEVLLAAWRVWGIATLQRLNGDFAFALHDCRDDSVILTRDLAGARPLYYARWGGGVAFASEYKALLSLPELPRRVDRDAVQLLQSRKQLSLTGSLLEGVHQFPAGHWAYIGDDAKVEPVRYWKVALDISSRSFAEQRREVGEGFLRAMERRTRGSANLGIALSGGIDSIAMVAAARKLYPDRTIYTFSAGDDDDDPELRWASRVAEICDTRHYATVVQPEQLKTDLRHLVWHLEDPIARSETLLTYRMGIEARKHVSILLGGYAADGLFAGMPRHRILALAGRVPVGSKTLGEIYSFSQTGVRPSGVCARVLAALYFRGKIPPVPRVIDAARPEPLPPLPVAGGELMNEVLRAGTMKGLAPWIQKVDRAHAAAGLRFTSPFFDPDLIHTAFRIPSRFKHTLRRDKHIWREAAREFVSDELANRPKYPQRMRETAAFCDVLEEIGQSLLAPDRVKARGLFDPSDVAGLLRRPIRGCWSPEHTMRIWTLILTELWAQIFVDSSGEYPSGPTLP